MITSKQFGLLLLALVPACALWGVEPDEIDFANEETEGLSAGGSDTGGDNNNDTDFGDGDGDPTGAGDGDGDPGDGDGDSGDGDGDGDGEPGDGDGDGDGEPGDGDGDGDGDEGTGDGDPGDGDGDGDPPVPCDAYDPIAVVEADNAIDIPNVMSSFQGSCGAPGPDAVFSFTATSDTSYEFTLSSDAFEGVLYLVVGSICSPLVEIACEHEGQAIIHEMQIGEVVYIIVDSDADPGAATLSIAAI